MQNLYLARRLCLIVCIVLLVGLAALQWLWVLGGSGTSIMYEAGLQRDLVERIVKDVETLAYRPVSEHAQATSELQNILPFFEHNQAALQTGDASLGLPHHPPDSVLALMIASQPDFTAIDVAARKIVASPEHIDALQVDIVVSHERGYFLALSEVSMAWMSDIDAAFWQIFVIEEGITGLVAVILLTEHVVVVRRIYQRMKENHGTS